MISGFPLRAQSVSHVYFYTQKTEHVLDETQLVFPLRMTLISLMIFNFPSTLRCRSYLFQTQKTQKCS